jgi:predicted  nucleic acid-binding Zn-ribbon protein
MNLDKELKKIRDQIESVHSIMKVTKDKDQLKLLEKKYTKLEDKYMRLYYGN